jgi:RNA polymerase sigma factor (sigma-70 family)
LAPRSFRPRPEHELADLSDEALLAHAVAAREAGDAKQVALALQLLAWGYQEIVRMRVAIKTPSEHVEDVADAALVRAIGSALRAGGFAGETTAEFRAWLHTVTDREVVDWWRRRERRPEEAPLPDEHLGEDESGTPVGVSEDEAPAVDVQALIDQALGELSDLHRRVVELHVFNGIGAKETAGALRGGMSENNVHKIASRFRSRMRELLED